MLILSASLGFLTFWPVGMTYLFMLLMLCSMLLMRSHWQQRWHGLQSYTITAILLVFAIWPVITLLWHPLYEGTGARFFHIVRVSLILMLGLLLLENERKWAIYGFLLGALVAALIISVHYIYPLPQWDPWKHLLLTKAHNASQKMVAMSCASAVLLVYLIRCHWPWYVKLCGLMVTIWMLAIVLGHGTSRNAQLLVVVLPLAIAVYYLRSIKAWLLIMLAFIALAFSAAQLQPQLASKVTSSLAGLARVSDMQLAEGSMPLRLKQWRVAAEQFQAHPLQGSGLGSWPSIWQQTPYLAPDSPNRALNNPHNDYLLNAAEVGVIGLLSTLAILIWFTYRSWRMNTMWGAMAFSLTSAVAITAFFNAPFRDGGFGMSLMWLMAAAASASYSAVTKSSENRSR